jgi:hypothetical protein
MIHRSCGAGVEPEARGLAPVRLLQASSLCPRLVWIGPVSGQQAHRSGTDGREGENLEAAHQTIGAIWGNGDAVGA